MLVGLLLWTCGLQDRPVSLELRASRLENAVPALAEATGLDLKCDQSIKDLVVIIKVRERPTKSLLRHVSEQVNARWMEQEDGSLLLKRLPEDISVQRAQQVALERQGIEAIKRRIQQEIGDGSYTAKEVEKFVAELDRVNKPPENGQGMSLDGPRLAGPASMLAKHILLTVPTSDLLNLRHGQGLMLTESPTRKQQMANAATLKAFDQFWGNVKTFVDLKPALLGANRGTGIDKQLVELEMPASGRGKTLASVSRFSNTIRTWVTVYARNGERVSEGFILGENVLPSWRVPAPLKATPRSKLPMSADTLLVQEFNNGTIWLDGEFSPESKEGRLLAILKDPEHRDPMSFLVTDMFLGWADQLGQDVVAHLPQYFARFWASQRIDGEIDLERLWFELERMRSIRVESRDGALLVRPVSEESSFLDRGYAERLGRLNRGLIRFENRLDATAQFLAETFEAVGNPGFGQHELGQWNVARVVPSNWHQQGLQFLPFWHELPRTLRDLISNGTPFAFRDLPMAARKYVDAVFGDWSWSSELLPNSHLAMQPSEHFPNGVPLDTRIVPSHDSDVKVSSVRMIRFADGLRENMTETSLKAIAKELNDPDRSRKFSPGLYGLTDSKETRVTRVATVSLTFVAPDGSSVKLNLEVPLERPQATTLGPEELVQKYLGG